MGGWAGPDLGGIHTQLIIPLGTMLCAMRQELTFVHELVNTIVNDGVHSLGAGCGDVYVRITFDR